MSDFLKGINLYLIGMMGAGKTTVGQAVAKQLGYQFFDTDAVIERVAGQSIPEIFAAVGESGFRDLESQVLGELCAYTRLAIATGGGIVLRRENWSYLRHGAIVWLDVPFEHLLARLQADDSRPLLQGEDLATKLQTLLDQRQALYAQADVRVSYQPGDTPEMLAQRVVELLQGVIKPAPVPVDYGN